MKPVFSHSLPLTPWAEKISRAVYRGVCKATINAGSARGGLVYPRSDLCKLEVGNSTILMCSRFCVWDRVQSGHQARSA